MNAYSKGQVTDFRPEHWRLISVHLNAEFHWNVGGTKNAAELGWALRDLAVATNSGATSSAVATGTYD